MGQYKVPQNVESEDKLIGPLSMKQFIYALIGLGWGFLMWRIFSIGGTAGIPFMFLTILPISGFMFLIAFGRREEQSFENYLIALIRFNVMPRKRLWMKDDVVDKVIVATPRTSDRTSVCRGLSAGTVTPLTTSARGGHSWPRQIRYHSGRGSHQCSGAIQSARLYARLPSARTRHQSNGSTR